MTFSSFTISLSSQTLRYVIQEKVFPLFLQSLIPQDKTETLDHHQALESPRLGDQQAETSLEILEEEEEEEEEEDMTLEEYEERLLDYSELPLPDYTQLDTEEKFNSALEEFLKDYDSVFPVQQAGQDLSRLEDIRVLNWVLLSCCPTQLYCAEAAPAGGHAVGRGGAAGLPPGLRAGLPVRLRQGGGHPQRQPQVVSRAAVAFVILVTRRTHSVPEFAHQLITEQR